MYKFYAKNLVFMRVSGVLQGRLHMPLYKLTYFLFDYEVKHAILVNAMTGVMCLVLSYALIGLDKSARARLLNRMVHTKTVAQQA